MPPRFLPTSLSMLMLAAALPLHAQTSSAAAAPSAVPLIERAKFFGNPTKAGGRLSPDGRWLSWVAPRDGVLNLWVAPLDKPEQARALTDERKRPIRRSFWSPDSKTLLYVNDQGGDENFRLYGVDVATRHAEELHAVREDRGARHRHQPQGEGPHPHRPEQPRPAFP